MKPIRVLQVFGAMNRGGAELRTLEMMRRMNRQHFAFDFWAVVSERGELDNEIRRLGGEVYYAKPGWRRWLSLFHHLLKSDYEVVHSNVYYSSGFVLALAALAGVPVRIAHFRTTDDGKGNSLMRRIYRRSMRHLLNQFATTLLSVSQGTMEVAWGPKWSHDPRCKVIYGGVDCRAHVEDAQVADVRAEFGFPKDCVLVLHVGRVTLAKNHERLLAIFAALARRGDYDKYRLLIAGAEHDAALGGRLRAIVRNLGVEEKVVFSGLRADVPRLLAAADIMIFPSRWEGLPGAVLEAAGTGLPVLASAIPGCLEIARHTDLVRCLPLEKPDSEWAVAAEEVLGRARRLSCTASPLAGTVFDSEISTRNFERMYVEAIQGKRPAESLRKTDTQCNLQ